MITQQMQEYSFSQAPYRTVRYVFRSYSDFQQEVNDELDRMTHSLGQTKVWLSALLNHVQYLDNRASPVSEMAAVEAIRWMRDYLKERENEWANCFILDKVEGRSWCYWWNKDAQ